MKQQPYQRYHEQRFWEVDLIELLKYWFSDISIFFQTMLLFVFIAIPVLIPVLIMWYLAPAGFTFIDWTP